MDNNDNITAALEAGKLLAGVDARITEIDGIPVALTERENGGVCVQVLDGVLKVQDERADAPRRLRGTATFTELPSFLAHVNRFKDAASVIFADLSTLKLTAVLNYHHGAGHGVPGGPGAPRWADHKAVYTCPLAPEWVAWTALHDKGITQAHLAEFIDEHITDVIGEEGNDNAPAPAKLLEGVRELNLHSAAKFQSAINLDTGEVQFKYEEEHKGGASGQMKLPRAFVIAIPVFKGGDRYRIEVRLKYRLKDAGITFFLALQLLDKVKDKAFSEVRQKAVEGYEITEPATEEGSEPKKLHIVGTGLPLYAGSPES